MKFFSPLLVSLLFVGILAPVAAFAIPTKTVSGLVPCGNVVKDGMIAPGEECTFDDLIILAQTVINFLIFRIGAPLAAVMFAYAGFLWVTNGGNPSQITQAKGIFTAVFLGFVVMLAAWLIVNMVVSFFLDGTFNFLASPSS